MNIMRTVKIAERRSTGRKTLRRSWATIIAVTLLVVTPVAAVNYLIDNHSLLSGGEESDSLREYVDTMRNAPVAVPYSYNDRSVKLLLAKESTADCLAIGSSHMMTLRRDRNPVIAAACAKLDNVGVTGASFEDVIIMLGRGETNPNVKTMVVGIDLWTMTRNSRRNWMRNSKEMFAARERFGLPSAPYQDALEMATADWIEQLFSFKYFMVNYKFIKRASEGKTTLTYDSRQLAVEDLKKEMALLPDASLSYPEEFRPTPRNEDLGTTDQWIEPPYFEQDVLDEFTTALRKVIAGGKKIILVEGPYHPYVVTDCPKPNICEGIKVIDPIARRLAQDLGVPLLGSYLPAPLDLKGEDFIDFQHIRGTTGWPKVRALD